MELIVKRNVDFKQAYSIKSDNGKLHRIPISNEDDHEQILPGIDKINPAKEELRQFGNAIEQNFSTGIDIERALQSIDIYREIVEKINKTTFHPLQN